ncbi:MAG: IS3 family transposase [Prolixibacteraceae bacterium]|jgi:transposase InsO family protein|nr:IS3 family transposase [Prolixibacteraceae bacterium]
MIDHKYYYSISQAKAEIFQFIEVWYNRERIHSVPGYKTPVEFMEMYNQEVA